jgi:2-polyprenyl-3-methyl-5-hydroxy-6-metoxy-1,4-benzoquinol methylase
MSTYDPGICCYCGSTAHTPVVTGPAVPIIACSNCGLMRQGPMSEAVASERIFIDYAGGFERFQRQKIEKDEAQVLDFVRISDRLEEYLPSKGRVLEIGAGLGGTLDGFRQKGWSVVGVEPGQWCCDYAKDRHGLDLICATFQDAGLQPESFDAVLLLHVIEHIDDPFKALREISQLVRPGGYLVLETPRYDTLTFRILKGRERSVMSDHLHYFTRKSMLAMCRDAGFEAQRVEAVGRTVTLDRLCFYFAKLLRSQRVTAAIARFSDFAHLNRLFVHINLHDMMRLYLRKRDRVEGAGARVAAG